MSTTATTTTTTVDWASIDTKGLSQFQIELAIERYITQCRLANARAEWNAQQEARKAENRKRVALRLKHCNALKRAGLVVKTKDSRWSSYGVHVSDTPNKDGSFIISFDRDPARAVNQRAKVQASRELELKLETRIADNGECSEWWSIKLA